MLYRYCSIGRLGSPTRCASHCGYSGCKFDRLTVILEQWGEGGDAWCRFGRTCSHVPLASCQACVLVLLVGCGSGGRAHRPAVLVGRFQSCVCDGQGKEYCSSFWQSTPNPWIVRTVPAESALGVRCVGTVWVRAKSTSWLACSAATRFAPARRGCLCLLRAFGHTIR